ncbi:MAG: carbohydrate kinase [Chitinophagales bacterium]|nr:carbohydrate kinase [Chitinophagales bacterium]
MMLDVLDGLCVLIVGDVMIDRYLVGSVSRISPEAPVPVVLQKSVEDRLGGAANVALNVKALGGVPFLCSLIGEDQDGQRFLDLLSTEKLTPLGIRTSSERCTTVKTRILGNHQQMLRIDQEDTHDLSANEEAVMLQRAVTIMDHDPIRVLILQDYNKGMLPERLIRNLIQEAKKRGIFIAVDPKKTNFFAYQGADLFKPNLKEVRESAPFPITPTLDSLQKAADFLIEKLQNRYTMLTLSEKGIFLDDGNGGQLYPTIARNISDVSGAGDTVISIAAMALATGMDAALVARLSNLAGGQVCESPGVVPVNRALLEKELAQ